MGGELDPVEELESAFERRCGREVPAIGLLGEALARLELVIADHAHILRLDIEVEPLERKGLIADDGAKRPRVGPLVPNGIIRDGLVPVAEKDGALAFCESLLQVFGFFSSSCSSSPNAGETGDRTKNTRIHRENWKLRKSELSLLTRLVRGSNLLLDVTLKAALAHRSWFPCETIRRKGKIKS